MIRRVSLGVLAMLTIAATAHAQVYSIPTHLPPAARVPVGDTDPLDELATSYKRGDTEQFNDDAMRLLRRLADASRDVRGQLGDLKQNYFRLVWISTGSDGKDVLNSALVHHTWSASMAARLPGLRKSAEARGPEVRDVLLTYAAEASLDSRWVFTPVAEPLATQLPDVISKLNPLAMLARSLGTESQAAALLVYVNRPDMMRSRATIAIKDTVTTLSSADDLLRKVNLRSAAIDLRQARASACAQEFNKRMTTAARGALKEDFCARTGDDCSAEVKRSLEAVLPAFVKDTGWASACAMEPWWGTGPDRLAAIEQEFLKLVAEAAPTVLTGESTLSNTPLTRWSFGVMTGVLFTEVSRDEARVKLDGNVIASAPMDRLMTMVILNYHPERYNAEWPDVTFAERFRWFGGVVLTPDIGLAVGAGLGIVRGLSVNAGAAWLFADTVKGDDAIGGVPSDPKRPFKLRGGAGMFLGLSYAFK